ncbi:hypothetical protein, partial [Burkholderia pseudomallei]|uniref:hypothetical protein n=1 Tax=Burkholderia pseudomallei TaxID=28450 RepID=UPI002155DAA1
MTSHDANVWRRSWTQKSSIPARPHAARNPFWIVVNRSPEPLRTPSAPSAHSAFAPYPASRKPQLL